MYKYKCGHKSDSIIIDNNVLSLSAFEVWRTSVGVDGDRTECWGCFCNKLNNKGEK